MTGPERIYPPRLREIQAQEAEEEKIEEGRRQRRRLVLIGLVALLILIPLGYGLVRKQTVESPKKSQQPTISMEVGQDEQIQISVMNACGVPGVAVKVADYLRDRRFDVADYGNATTSEPLTLVIDRTGDSLAAAKVAYALGLPPERQVVEIDSSLFVKATVVIGHDYPSLRPFN